MLLCSGRGLYTREGGSGFESSRHPCSAWILRKNATYDSLAVRWTPLPIKNVFFSIFSDVFCSFAHILWMTLISCFFHIWIMGDAILRYSIVSPIWYSGIVILWSSFGSSIWIYLQIDHCAYCNYVKEPSRTTGWLRRASSRRCTTMHQVHAWLIL